MHRQPCSGWLPSTSRTVTRTRLEPRAHEIPIATGVLILDGPRPDCPSRRLFGRTHLQFGAG